VVLRQAGEDAMAVERLSASEIAARLGAHRGWHLAPGGAAIRREWRFADFAEAFAFMTQVARLAEAQDHHPEWSNVYNRVTIALTTHDAGGLSARDFRLAAGIDGLG